MKVVYLHRETKDRKRTVGDGEEIFEGPAGNMDPYSVVIVVKYLLSNNFDLVRIIHDNDATAIKRARAEKQHELAHGAAQ